MNELSSQKKNIFGRDLQICGCQPMTGWFRDGYCRTDRNDLGRHSVCSVVTDDFLEFSKNKGNDLKTPQPDFGFPGLKAGDHWCLCVGRWKEAHENNCAPPLILESCEESCLKTVDELTLKKYDHKTFKLGSE